MESPFKADALKGKVALITGGRSGIGFEISTQFGKHGASIAIMGRKRQVLDSAVSALRLLGFRCASSFNLGMEEENIMSMD
ncbi:putative 2,4-dienoyl-CoA reductase (NADPH) [Rosa chinensis]|uniref:2,4-dienoyl-CoA reductase [(3E)-enoyl-CoA-producing] n=1 Tax=Rosa chinensis TaxID=74649 RepID=A0A2P6PUR2_ROSCH|nr:putative 2,4-dienoyl-CoA reductase (NADPH) [Rosa chinensis]